MTHERCKWTIESGAALDQHLSRHGPDAIGRRDLACHSILAPTGAPRDARSSRGSTCASVSNRRLACFAHLRCTSTLPTNGETGEEKQTDA